MIKYEFFLEFVEELKQYLIHALDNAFIFVIFYVILCIFLYRIAIKNDKEKKTKDIKRALIVIAHPDDECMFFGPTIYSLGKCGVEIYMLCLSIGNYRKDGNIRKTELYKSCEVLGIKEGQIEICIDAYMPDDPLIIWPSDHIAKIIHHHVETLSIDTIITFDKGGVSHHPNHTSIFYGVARLYIEKRLPKGCKIFALESVNVLRKYWGYFDLPLSYILSSHWFVLSFKEKDMIKKAMKKHATQMVWFRHLYLIFSRFLMINTLRNITTMDLELELELDD